MPTTTEARGALMQKSPTPATPGLDPQRFSILVQRSSKELKDEDADADPLTSHKLPSKSIPKPANRLAVVNSRESVSRRALSATRKLWQEHADLVVYHGLIYVILGWLCASALWWLQACNVTASMWKTLMETSGFVNWPEPETQPRLLLICAATPIVATILSCAIVPWSLYTRSNRGMKLFLGVIVVTAFMCIIAYGLDTPPSLDTDAVESLTSQTDAVANFNRGFCLSWCRNSDAGLAALVRGDCGPKQKTVFDKGFARFDLQDWCLEAIAHQKFDLTVEYSGVSPFAGLKGEAGSELITPVSNFSTTCFCSALFLGLLVFFILDSLEIPYR